MLDRREILNSLLSKRITPFTAFKLKSDFDQKVQNISPITWVEVLPYLNNTYTSFSQSLEIPILDQVFSSLKEEMLKEDTVSDAFEEFQQEDVKEVARFLGDLHIRMQDLEHKKEELIHFISLFNNANEYFTSFDKSLPTFLKLILPQVKDVSYFKSDPLYEAILQDLGTNISWLKNRVKELNLWVEDILNKRINRLYKIESSIRLLQKYRNYDGGRNIEVEAR